MTITLKSVVVPAVAAATAALAAHQPGEDGRYTISAPGIKAQVGAPLLSPKMYGRSWNLTRGNV